MKIFLIRTVKVLTKIGLLKFKTAWKLIDKINYAFY